MKMFVANGTHQNIDFQYRLPEVRNYRQQIINIGGQIRISGDLSAKDIDAIISAHEIYGMVEASEISQKHGTHIPYIYSVDKPISANSIAELVAHNRVVNNALGVKYRQEAAVAVSQQITNNNENPDVLRSLEMGIKEKPSNKDLEVDEVVRVTTDFERGASQDPNRPIVEKRSLF
jgi:hypothetical protein